MPNVGDMLNTYFISIAESALNAFFTMVAKLIFSPQNLPQFANDIYNIFLGAGAMLMLVILAVKFVQLEFDISNDNAQTTVGELLGRTVKASAMIVICPFLLKVLVGQIAFPLGDFMFSQIAANTSKSVEAYFTSSGISAISSGFMLAVMVGFVAIAVICFFFKMCVYQVDLIFLQIYSIPVSCSMIADDNNYMSIWWRELISQIATILTQVLCMVGVTWVFSNTFSWYNFMLLIGCCVNLIKGPNFLRSMWYSTGTGKSAMNAGGKLATRMMMVQSLFGGA